MYLTMIARPAAKRQFCWPDELTWGIELKFLAERQHFTIWSIHSIRKYINEWEISLCTAACQIIYTKNSTPTYVREAKKKKMRESVQCSMKYMYRELYYMFYVFVLVHRSYARVVNKTKQKIISKLSLKYILSF